MTDKVSKGLDSLSNSVLAYQTSKDAELLDDICHKSIPTINTLATHYSNLCPVTQDEFFSEGCLSLISSVIPNYGITFGKEGKVVGFRTYLRGRVHGAMRDWMRKVDPMARSQRKRLKKLQRSIESLKIKNGIGGYTIEELANETKESEASIRETLGWDQGIVVSLSRPSKGSGNFGGLEGTLLSSDNPVELCEVEDLLDITYQVMDEKLPKKVSEAIRLRYLEHMMFKEIGKIQGVSESRACKSVKDGIERLKCLVALRTRKGHYSAA